MLDRSKHEKENFDDRTNFFSTWDGKYHVVFTPKYRKKELYGFICRKLKDVQHRLGRQKECLIEEGYLIPNHIHMLIVVSKISIDTQKS